MNTVRRPVEEVAGQPGKVNGALKKSPNAKSAKLKNWS